MVSPDVPTPMHGFELAAIAFCLYFAAAASVTYGLLWLGVPTQLSAVAFLAIAALLLKPFLPVFRRLTPDRPDPK